MIKKYNIQNQLDFPKENTMWSDFIESAENEKALTMLKQWPNWPTYGLIICGPSGAGKTHLAQLWGYHNAYIIQEQDFEKAPRDLPYQSFVFDMHISSMQQQIWLFHLLNIIRERQGYILIITNEPIENMGLQLQDLSSRLQELMFIQMRYPHDELLYKIIKQMAQKEQMNMTHETMQYILTRTPRDINIIKQTFACLNNLSLSMQKPITIPFIRKLIENGMFAFFG